jgi:hypothetical protein
LIDDDEYDDDDDGGCDGGDVCVAGSDLYVVVIYLLMWLRYSFAKTMSCS